MNYAKCPAHFARNKPNRQEPDWAAPAAIRPKVRSAWPPALEQFRLGDGGRPAKLELRDA